MKTILQLYHAYLLPTAIAISLLGCTSTPETDMSRPDDQTESEKDTPAFTGFGEPITERAELAREEPEILEGISQKEDGKVIAVYPCHYRSPDDLRQAIMGLVSME